MGDNLSDIVLLEPSESSIPKLPRFFQRLLGNRNFSLLFFGQIVSQMGDSMYQIGLLWLVLELTGSKSAMGLVAMTSYLPMLIFGLFAGILVDMFDRRRLMLIADMARTLVVLILPLTYFAGTINIAVILGISFSLASFATVFNPARDSLIPGIVRKENLLKANSLIQASNYSAILLGPALGGAIIGFVGVAHLFTFDALTFLFSFLAIFFIHSSPGRTGRIAMQTFRGHFLEIVRHIHYHKRLRFLLGLTAVNNFFIMGPAIVGTPIFVKEILHQGALSYALVESSLGLGMVIGAVLVNFSVRYLGKGKTLLLGMIFDGLTYALAYWCRSPELFMILIAFHAVGIPHIVVTRTALVQEWVDAKKMGRVFSLVNMSVIGMTALTTGVTGWLAETVSIDLIFGLFGTAGMFCGFVGLMKASLRRSN